MSTSVSVHSGDVGAEERPVPRGPTWPGGTRIGQPVAPGDYLLVMALSADGPFDGSLAVWGGDGIQILASTYGHDVFLRGGRDFKATVAADAELGLDGAQVYLDAARSESASRSMFGSFYNLRSAGTPDTVSIEYPDGSAAEKSGSFGHEAAWVAGGPAGQYMLKIHGAQGAGSAPVAILADVTPPA
ncbi:MAG TPA: hypothetical protein VNE62_04080 [Actinomycetota bacterium]|nr:hypothetical protein [Actinomycetota bacterium]